MKNFRTSDEFYFLFEEYREAKAQQLIMEHTGVWIKGSDIKYEEHWGNHIGNHDYGYYIRYRQPKDRRRIEYLREADGGMYPSIVFMECNPDGDKFKAWFREKRMQKIITE